MKTEELIALGLTEEQANSVFAMNGKDITSLQQRVTTAEAERDNFKSQLDTANATLKRFEGIDPDKIKGELETYKTQAEEAQKNFDRQITQRDQKDWLNKQLDEFGVSSPFARKQIISECMAEDSDLKWKGGEFVGFGDYMKKAKEQDSSLYMTAEEKAEAEKAEAAKKKAPAFTGSAGTGGSGGEDKDYKIPMIF